MAFAIERIGAHAVSTAHRHTKTDVPVMLADADLSGILDPTVVMWSALGCMYGKTVPTECKIAR